MGAANAVKTALVRGVGLPRCGISVNSARLNRTGGWLKVSHRFSSNFAQIGNVKLQFRDFYDYLNKVQGRLSEEKEPWPRALMEFLGNNTRLSQENLVSCTAAIQTLDDAIRNYHEVEKLVEDAATEADEEQKAELFAIAGEEIAGIQDEMKDRNDDIIEILRELLHSTAVPKNVVLEVSAGVGGQEAMLFASELFDMYHSFCANCGQDFEIIQIDRSDIDGYINASANIYFTDPEFYTLLCQESGTHRVQRVPTTEKSGRIHTSTASVAILPVFEDHEIDIPVKELEIVRYKKSNSPGGQHANKAETAVRIKHLPTGKVVECCATKSQDENREMAIRLLKAKLAAEKAEAQESALVKARRQQVKNRERSDKIRTYNFNQDRVTDHRIGFSTHNVAKFLSGDTALLNLMKRLNEKQEMDELNLTIKLLLEEGKKFFNFDTLN